MNSLIRSALLVPATLLTLVSCESRNASTHNRDGRPELPDAIVDNSLHEQADSNLPLPCHSPEAQQLYGDVLEHPWFKSQPQVTTLTQLMVDDIRSLQALHQRWNIQRKEAGVPEITFEEETQLILNTLNNIQDRVHKLPINFPPQYYSVLNIPDTPQSLYSTPIPFQIHKRIYLGDTALGLPFYLDVRAFPHESALERQSDVDRVVEWHLQTLEGGFKSFDHQPGKLAIVLIGRGKRNMDHYNNSHGLATQERGVFLAFYPTDEALYVLYADAPWETFDKYEAQLLEMVR